MVNSPTDFKPGDVMFYDGGEARSGYAVVVYIEPDGLWSLGHSYKPTITIAIIEYYSATKNELTIHPYMPNSNCFRGLSYNKHIHEGISVPLTEAHKQAIKEFWIPRRESRGF